MSGIIKIVKTKNLAADAADLVIRHAKEAITARGKFILGLCGGKTPEAVYAEIAKRTAAYDQADGIASDNSNRLDWSKIVITFGDERCVPPDSPESNFRMANESLLKKVPIPPENILRIRGELEPEAAAIEYEKKITGLQHDLLLLGMGDDGHTASLFPGTAALEEEKRLVVANFIPKFNAHRITFTYKTINASRNICFLVNDPKKEKIVDEIMESRKLEHSDNSKYPAAKVVAKESVTWIVGIFHIDFLK